MRPRLLHLVHWHFASFGACLSAIWPVRTSEAAHAMGDGASGGAAREASRARHAMGFTGALPNYDLLLSQGWGMEEDTGPRW